MSFTIDNWMVGWNPTADGWKPSVERRGTAAGAIEVGPWPDKTGWSDQYVMTMGCCELAREHFPLADKVAQLFIDFHTCVVRDGIAPQDAHREFLKIDEYRRRISPDIHGAEE